MNSSEPKRKIAGGPEPLRRPPFVTTGYTADMVADVVSIQQLMARYCHVLDSDTSAASEIAAMFSPDGAVCPAYENDVVHRGREAMAQWTYWR